MNMVRESREENPCYEVGASSILGGRKYQQDYGYYYTDRRQVLGIVCDGMGGLQGGERASQTAVETMVQEFFQAKDIVSVPDFLLQTAERMNRAVLDLKDDKGKGLDAGTTLVAAYFSENKMYWVSAYLTTEKTVNLVARVNGTLQSTSYVPGGRVKQGQLLFVIEPTLYKDKVEQAEAELKTAQAQLEYARNNYSRIDDFY